MAADVDFNVNCAPASDFHLPVQRALPFLARNVGVNERAFTTAPLKCLVDAGSSVTFHVRIVGVDIGAANINATGSLESVQ